MTTVLGGRPSFEELRELEDIVFPGPLAFSDEFLQDLIKEPVFIFLSAYDGDRFVGYAAATDARLCPMTRKEKQAKRDRALYFLSLSVHPDFRNQGIGQELIIRRLYEGIAQGYTNGVGHFHEGASAHLARKYLKDIAEFPIADYGGSGEIYYYIAGEIPSKAEIERIFLSRTLARS